MNCNQIRTTDLSLLRKILEDNYENSDDVTHFSNDIIKSNNETEEFITKKFNSKIKRKSLRNLKPDFYLSGDVLIIKNWLKDKNKMFKQKKREMLKLKREEIIKNELEQKRIEERLTLARVSYDNWLKEIRKRKPVPNDTIQSQSNNHKIKNANNKAYDELVAKKQTDKKLVSVDEISVRNINNEHSQPPRNNNNNKNNDNNNNIHKPMLSKQKSNLSNRRPKTSTENMPDRAKTFNISTESEDFNKTVIDLRRTKMKQIDQSKKRVDSGIIFHRNKTKNVISSKKSNDVFLWKFAEQEKGVIIEQLPYSKSNSRSRKIDQINHNHENPFIDKSSEVNKFIL